MSTSPIIKITPLGFPWETLDPFLFCVHHDDAYPRANAQMGPAASLAGRDMGNDFSRKDGWSMYHGLTVPGFPSHPHRGFETVTIVRKGLVDHADSAGALARYGRGDVQWLTAGAGVQHSEMFPLLARDADNPLELFQIWLNLPAASKMAAPNFTMFWSEHIPRQTNLDAQGNATEIAVIAGRLGGPEASLEPLAPPPDSWAAQAAADLAIWTVKMAPGARWTLPAATTMEAQRMLYFFKGGALSVAGQALNGHAAIQLRADAEVELVNGDAESELLMLQGRPVGEPVALHGPFVMNTREEIVQAIADYRNTGFGGWPWPDSAPVHGSDPARFARHADGREERP